MRLFIALDITDAIRNRISLFLAGVSGFAPEARWAKPESLHVTLKFIGEVATEKLDRIHGALAAVHSADPVDMQFRGLGFFPNERRPRVLWCGVEASANLAELAANIDRALAPLGIPPESREFMPHLTLARFQSDGGPRHDLEKRLRAAGDLKSYDFGRTQESNFHLIESKLKPSGAEYRRLQTFPIVKGSG